MSRSPRSKDAAALNFRLGHLCRLRANLSDLTRVTYSEETNNVLFAVEDATKLYTSHMIDVVTREITLLQALILRRASETKRRKEEKKNAQVR